jgi:hypothetical protein
MLDGAHQLESRSLVQFLAAAAEDSARDDYHVLGNAGLRCGLLHRHAVGLKPHPILHQVASPHDADFQKSTIS